MAFGLGGYGASYREPAPRRLSRLTLEELVGALGEPAATPAPRPAPVTSLRDLQGPDRRQAQTESLWTGLAALGANVSGDRRGAMAGLGAIQEAQDRALAGANARQEATWQAENERRAAEAAQAKKRQEAAALYGMYERVTEGEDPASPFAERAETAARAGSMSELEKLGAERPMRDAARAKGYNPDAWETATKLQEELKAQLDRAKAQTAWDEGEKARMAEKAQMERDAKLAEEKALREAGLGVYRPPQYEPPEHAAAVAEAQARARAKVEGGGAGGIKGRLGQAPGGQWGWLTPPDPTNPRGKFVPIDGQPVAQGGKHIFTVDGVPYFIDQAHPEAGAFEIPVKEPGAAPPAPGKPAKPAPAPSRSSTGDGVAAMGFPGGAPVAKKPAPAAPKAKPAPAAPPAADQSQQDATRKLSAVKDAGIQQKIKTARAAGYSDGEIAAFLGIH